MDLSRSKLCCSRVNHTQFLSNNNTIYLQPTLNKQFFNFFLRSLVIQTGRPVGPCNPHLQHLYNLLVPPDTLFYLPSLEYLNESFMSTFISPLSLPVDKSKLKGEGKIISGKSCGLHLPKLEKLGVKGGWVWRTMEIRLKKTEMMITIIKILLLSNLYTQHKA